MSRKALRNQGCSVLNLRSIPQLSSTLLNSDQLGIPCENVEIVFSTLAPRRELEASKRWVLDHEIRSAWNHVWTRYCRCGLEHRTRCCRSFRATLTSSYFPNRCRLLSFLFEIISFFYHLHSHHILWLSKVSNLDQQQSWVKKSCKHS